MTLPYALPSRTLPSRTMPSRTLSTSSALGAVVSLLLHVLFLAIGGLSWRHAVNAAKPVEHLVQVSVFERAAETEPPAPAAPLRSAPAEPRVAPLVARPHAVPRPAPEPVPVEKPVLQKEQPPEDAPVADAPATESPSAGDSEAPASNASAVIPSASGNGLPGATGTSSSAGGTSLVLPFGAGMTRPVQLDGGDPQYTREAQAARVEGRVLVRCVITTLGSVEDCQVLKGVPMLTEIALANLKQSRYQPVTYQGHPQAIRYLFTFNFKLP